MWEIARWGTMNILQKDIKRRLKPKDLAVFPWEKEVKATSKSKEEIAEETEKAKALIKKLKDVKMKPLKMSDLKKI